MKSPLLANVVRRTNPVAAITLPIAESLTAGTNPDTAQAVREELADVQLYLVRLASVLGVDLNEAVQAKLQKNAAKYPADKARGSSKKYTEL